MRDVRQTSVTERYTKTQMRQVACIGSFGPSSSTNINFGARVTFRSQRSDINATAPSAAGKFFRPTDYAAFFSSTAAVPGSCELGPVENFCPAYKRYYKYSWDGCSDYNAHRLGCDATTLEPSIPASVIADGRNKIIAQLQNNDFNAGQFIGELKESVETVTSLIGDAVRLYRSLRRPITSLRNLRLRDVRKIHTRAASEYLRFVYGVRPIMSDIQAVSDALYRRVFDEPVGFAYSESYDESFDPGLYGTLRFPKIANIDGLEGSLKRGVEHACFYKVRNPSIYQLERYGLLNPIALAWELTTLSFVVDWFTGIGSFLSGLTAGAGLDYLWGYETRFLKGSFVALHAMGNPANLISGDLYARCPVRVTAMRRYANPGFTPPPVYLRADLNLSQALSSIALLVAFASGRKTPR